MVALLLLACAPDALVLTAVSVPEEAPLAIDVAWGAADVDALWLERTLADGTVRSDPVDPAGGEARALGHPALSAVTVRLVADGIEGEPVTVTTGNLDPAVPTFSTEGTLCDEGSLLLVSTSLLDASPSDVTVALDHSGQVVWFHIAEDVSIFRPDLLAVDDGWWSLRLDPPTGTGKGNMVVHRGWGGEVREEVAAPGSHHAFAMSDGALVWPVDAEEVVDSEVWVGDALLVDGEAVFSVWDDLDAAALIDSTPERMGRRLSHINGVSVQDGAALLTMGAQDAVLEVDLGSGEPLRWLGAPSPVDLPSATWSEDEAMVLPHMARWTDAGTLLLTGSSADFSQTWATEFAIEGDGLVPVWSHGRDEGLGTPALGSAERLANGDTLVSFGTRGVIHRVRPDGEVVGAVSVELGRILGRSIEIDALPLQPVP